jgi:hypothetical protein
MVKEEDTKEEDPEGRDNADEALKAYRRCLLLFSVTFIFR